MRRETDAIDIKRKKKVQMKNLTNVLNLNYNIYFFSFY